MSDYLDSQRGWMPPIVDPEAPGQYTPQTISGTGTTEASNSRAFSKDRLHLLTVGANAVRIGFSKSSGLSPIVPALGGLVLAAGASFLFRAFDAGTYGSLYVYVEAADGLSAFEVTVQQRET